MTESQNPALEIPSKKYFLAYMVGCALVILLPNIISKDAANLASSFSSIFTSGVLVLLSSILLLKSGPRNSLGKASVMIITYASFSFIAEILWVVFEHVFHTDPFPSIADFFWLSGYFFLFLFLVHYLKPVKKFITKNVLLFATITSVIFLVPSILVTYNQNYSVSWFDLAVTLAYPVSDALLLFPLSIGVILFLKIERNVLWHMFLLAAISYTVGDTFFLVLSVNDSYYTGHPMDILYVAGYVLFSFGVYNNIKLYKKYEEYWKHPVIGDKTVLDSVRFEKVNRFVIPFILGAIILVATIVWLNFFYFGMTLENKSGATYLFYIVLSVIASFSVIILVINHNLMKLVRLRTHELQSERDNLERLVKEKTEQMLKSERLSVIGELASSLGHDLRNHLTVIKSSHAIMKLKARDKLDQDTMQHFERVDDALSRIIGMINDMLNFVRMAPMNIEDTLITNILTSAISKIRVPDTVRINLPLDAVIIKCDPKKLETVFINLITNSIEAMKNKGQINIRIKDEGANVLIDVEDSGQGIADDVLPKIFHPLFTTKESGTGLGLPSCKNIVEQHNGTITVKTNPTVFTVMLPKNPSI